MPPAHSPAPYQVLSAGSCVAPRGGQRLSAAGRPLPPGSRRPGAIGEVADAIRRRRFPEGNATYNVDRNINYTNVCVYKCRFCAFYREPGDAEGYLLPFEEIGRKVEETLALNGTGILCRAACTPTCRSPTTRTCCATCGQSYPAIHVHAFSPPEVKFIARRSG